MPILQGSFQAEGKALRGLRFSRQWKLSSFSLWPTAFQSLAPDFRLPFIEPDSFCFYLYSQIGLHHSVEKKSCQFNLAEALLVLDRQPLSPEHGLQSSPVI